MAMKIDPAFGAILMSGLLLVIIGQIIPFIGTVLEDATPSAGATSEWNTTYNPNFPRVSETWGTLVTVLGGGLSLSAIFYAISPIIGKKMLGEQE